MARARWAAVLVVFFTAATGCTEKAASQNEVGTAVSPTSSDANEGPVSPELEPTLKRDVAKGDGRACSNQLALNYIMNQAVTSNRFDEIQGWTPALRAAFYDTYVSDVRQIVLNSYNADAKLISCSGTYLEISNDRWFSGKVDYSIQLTVDGEVVFRIDNLHELQNVARAAHEAYWYQAIAAPAEASRRAAIDANIAATRTLESEQVEQDQQRERAVNAANQAEAKRRERPLSAIEYAGPPPNLPGPTVQKSNR